MSEFSISVQPYVEELLDICDRDLDIRRSSNVSNSKLVRSSFVAQFLNSFVKMSLVIKLYINKIKIIEETSEKKIKCFI